MIFSAPIAKYIGAATYAYPTGQASLYALIVNFIVAVVVSQIFKSKQLKSL